MTREEAKAMFRNDKDAYGKPRGVMRKIDQIYDDFEKELEKMRKQITDEDWLKENPPFSGPYPQRTNPDLCETCKVHKPEEGSSMCFHCRNNP